MLQQNLKGKIWTPHALKVIIWTSHHLAASLVESLSVTVNNDLGRMSTYIPSLLLCPSGDRWSLSSFRGVNHLRKEKVSISVLGN